MVIVTIFAEVRLRMMISTAAGDGKGNELLRGGDVGLTVMRLPNGAAHTCSLLKDIEKV